MKKLFKKQPKEVETLQDKKALEYNSELNCAAYELRKRVREVIIKLGVINLYPDGADKNKAIADCEQAKYSMLCTIGHYDTVMAEYTHFLENTKNERIVTQNWYNNWDTSHTLVENIYKNYQKFH